MKIRKPWIAAPLGAATAVTLLTGCGSGDGGGAGTGDAAAVIMGMSDDVKSVDPASGYDPGSWIVFNNVFQSLLAFPKGGTTPEPDAAQSCGFVGAGGTTFRCVLRPDQKFSNGHALTAKDVKFSFERTLRIADEAGPAVMLSSIAGIDTPDDKTVVFRLKHADATFPSKIASGAGAIVDSREYPADALRTDGKAIGSGPYTLDVHEPHKQLRFAVNPEYSGAAKPRNSGVTLKLYDRDQAALRAAVEKGEIDLAFRGLSAADVAGLDTAGAGGVTAVQGTGAEVQHLVFNLKDPVLGKAPVRQAIAQLIDRGALVNDVHHGTVDPLYSIVPAGIAGHTTAFSDRYGLSPRPDKAREILQKAGITGKTAVTLWSTPSRFGPATDPEMRAIAQQLNASGLFSAEVKSVEYERYEKDVQAGKYGIYVKGWVPDYPDPDNFTQPFFGPGNVLGNHYENDEITDRILPATAAATDRTATTGDYARLQALVAEDVPMIPLWQGKQYAVTRPNVSGAQWSLDSSTVFRFAELGKS
ncbi:ABC transporter substrate-binding protein [Streptomyces sp. BI20]|uniref:ABC transporter substrate-binding protein n=1 Tax=Streptomyces sp. BI20 TaxID=3403460 RepID=UPI003C73ED94